MQIEFSVVKLDADEDPFTFLREAPNRVLQKQACVVLDAAFSCGGYVAGGFARLIAYNTLIKQRQEFASVTGGGACELTGSYLEAHIKEIAVQHLSIRRRISDIDSYTGVKDGSPDAFRNTGKGDIDLFFPDKDAVSKFVDLIRPLQNEDGFTVRKSKMNVALELGCDDRVRVQAITAFTGDMHDRLRSFDIFNAMVAYTPGQLTLPNGWHDLEETQTLHVVNWTNGYVINRINKYFNNFHYKNLSSATAHDVTVNAMKYLAELHALGMTQPDNGRKASSLKFNLSRYLPSMSNEDLLLLTSIIPTCDYRKLTPMGELHKRLEKSVK